MNDIRSVLVQKFFDRWGAKKYPDYAGETFSLETGTETSGGCCPTREYTSAVVEVYAGNKRVDTLPSVDLRYLLTEIIGASL